MLLTEKEIHEGLLHLPEWKLEGNAIRATYGFRDFVGAMDFVNQVAVLAEKANHHPDIDIRWNKVHLTLTTHSKGGLTQLDLDLAKQISQTQ